MSDNLKILILKTIISEKFCQNLKVYCFQNMICEENSYTIQFVFKHCKRQTINPLVTLVLSKPWF